MKELFQKRQQFIRSTLIGSLLLILIIAGVVLASTGKTTVDGEPVPVAEKIPTRSPEDLAKPHLKLADEESERVIEDQVKSLKQFFADAKNNSREFAASALGWGSKRRLIQDRLPFTRSDRHKDFIKDKFEEIVFDSTQCENAIKQVVKEYLTHLRSIENKMLVDLRTDAEGFSSEYPIAQFDDEQLQKLYDALFTKAIEGTGNEVQAEITRVIVATIAERVLVQVAVRLGLEAGILGVGAASSIATAGISLAAAVIISVIVENIWNWYSDPKDALSSEIDGKLDEMSRLLIEGSEDVKGLKQRLQEFARERAAIRKKVVLMLLQPTPGVEATK